MQQELFAQVSTGKTGSSKKVSVSLRSFGENYTRRVPHNTDKLSFLLYFIEVHMKGR